MSYVMHPIPSDAVHPAEPCIGDVMHLRSCGRPSGYRVVQKDPLGHELVWSDYCDDHAPAMDIGVKYGAIPMRYPDGLSHRRADHRKP